MAANSTKRRTIYRGKSQEKYEQTVDENSSFNEFEFWTNCRTLVRSFNSSPPLRAHFLRPRCPRCEVSYTGGRLFVVFRKHRVLHISIPRLLHLGRALSLRIVGIIPRRLVSALL
ncbi:unnamed protein product [Brassica rapa]|uniref:Uncharacterized protein n=1 Tax=Brassica campestris TaxID=3711 RepID=A0A3P6CPP8_BRACM|nr:unnamed protein product [Brassica rapa]VDD17646.1 unnamed protein product [Brassica rapa]